MKLVIVNGSPRSGGNSDFISSEMQSHCAELNIKASSIVLREKEINFCTGCDICHNPGNKCSIKDQFSEHVFYEILEADALFLVSPVYQGGVTGIMKNFMDRCEMFRNGRLLYGKLCGGAAIGGYPGGGQELTLMQIQYFSHICAMRYVASWGKIRSHLGGHCIAYEKGEVSKDTDGIISCKNVISEIAKLANI